MTFWDHLSAFAHICAALMPEMPMVAPGYRWLVLGRIAAALLGFVGAAILFALAAWNADAD